MASDVTSNMKYEPMRSMSLAITYPTAADAKKVFETLANGGQATMPLNASFFADAFGMLVDRFGTPWTITGGMKPGM
jgi:PhnB protein